MAGSGVFDAVLSSSWLQLSSPLGEMLLGSLQGPTMALRFAGL